MLWTLAASYAAVCQLRRELFLPHSPELARQLKIQHSTDCVGTFNLNRKNVPKEVKDKKLKKVEIIAWHSGPVTVLKWCDKRSITMVSTYHSADTQRVSKTGKVTEKPLCVTDYNHNTGGGSWLEGPVTAYVRGWEKEDDQMVPQTFQEAIELYCSQFNRCLQTSHGKKYTAAVIQNTVSGMFVYEILTCWGQTECKGAACIW